MKIFPEFIMQPVDRVANALDPSMKDVVFDGAEGTQIVFWQFEESGEVPEHVHDFWEYCVVVEGTMDTMVGGKMIHLDPGDECVVPPSTKHSGRFQ
jgi:quercetin dioxygenase-like cupin family protein